MNDGMLNNMFPDVSTSSYPDKHIPITFGSSNTGMVQVASVFHKVLPCAAKTNLIEIIQRKCWIFCTVAFDK